ncbi:MAG TPA: hypothetical protein PLW65_17580, partial [Pseudomonadota bacterium]|nr:hypothetical protein [Pseudomonadota bacterium]
ASLDAEVAAKRRPVRVDAIAIKALELTGAAPGVTFTVRCGKGTYIRALARDLGERLGVGAHLTALRRLRVGRFRVEDGCSSAAPDEITRGAVKPQGPAAALAHLPSFVAPPELASRLRQGHRGALGELAQRLPPASSAMVALDEGGQLIAVLEPDLGSRPGDARASSSAGNWIIGRGFTGLPA